MTAYELFNVACEAWRVTCREQGWEFVQPVFEKSNVRVELNNVGLCTADGTMVAIYHEGQAGKPAPARCIFDNP
jgi:hypothetical protein